MSSRDNSYANTDKKTLFLSDYVDNESIGKLTWSILQQIREDDEKDEKEKIISVNQLNYTSTRMVDLFMICGD